MGDIFNLGDPVSHGGRAGRIVALSRWDASCIVRYGNDTLSVGTVPGSAWVPLEDVSRIEGGSDANKT